LKIASTKPCQADAAGADKMIGASPRLASFDALGDHYQRARDFGCGGQTSALVAVVSGGSPAVS